ncbi:response regulator [bacterium]|nr:response regulator [bacterium]
MHTKKIIDFFTLPAAIVTKAGIVVARNRVLEVAIPAIQDQLNIVALVTPVDGGKIKVDHEWSGLVEVEGEEEAQLLSILPFDQETVLFLFGREKGQRRRSTLHLERIGSIAGSVAHDLNNILTGILGHVSFLRLSFSKDPALVESLLAIEEGAKRAAALTGQVLSFARDEKTELKPIELSQVVRTSLALIRGALPPTISIESHLVGSGFTVYGDEGKLSQVLMNLLVNARDALPQGGRVDVFLAKVIVDTSETRGQVVLNPGEYIRLSVIDNGTGISEEIKAKIFEPFFTTKDANGTGLGLATVKRVVEGMKGAIEVTSDAGRGAQFHVYFPAMQAASTSVSSLTSVPTKEDASARVSTNQGQGKVLVIDDEQVVRQVVQRSLEHFGYLVETAADGIAGLEKLKDTAFDLILLDMMMPKMSGEEVFRRARELVPTQKVLLMSGFVSEKRAQAVLDAGGKGFIHKPFSVEDLSRAVHACLSD